MNIILMNLNGKFLPSGHIQNFLWCVENMSV